MSTTYPALMADRLYTLEASPGGRTVNSGTLYGDEAFDEAERIAGETGEAIAIYEIDASSWSLPTMVVYPPK